MKPGFKTSSADDKKVLPISLRLKNMISNFWPLTRKTKTD